MGERHTVDVGPVAHGGHCVARIPVEPPAAPPGTSRPPTRVVFVRHALPGERVVVEITEGTDQDRYWRGDAVAIESPSPDRVAPPCPVAGPGLCGGCDFQHVAMPAQRALKTEVVREQLVRLGRLAPDHPVVAGLEVEPVPGDQDGLRWRTRVRYATAPDGRRGMRKHRSHEVVPVDDCLIALPDARQPSDLESSAWAVEAVETGWGSHSFAVPADGFWQVHPGAPKVLVETVLELLAPRPGERALDLYAGVGLFARFLLDAVGRSGEVVAVEGDEAACRHARINLGLEGTDDPTTPVEVTWGRVDTVLASAYGEPWDLVVLDPPREGARREVVEQIVARSPRAVAYVACDPAALARDVETFVGHGYRLERLRAFDLFPMT
ncbi:class I SAM-dependent RNA methyltransferase, partial [Nocardioides sp.]|uniref:class I SAM-dependent RNA methyltransferase n=1 Tax=Nocardioides sp. TaxID=35761 RepID=UPI002D7F7FA7